MVVVADINTIWRRKPFEAMAAETPILGLAPRDFVSGISLSHSIGRPANFHHCPVAMLPGWASKLAMLSGWQLWRRIQSESKKLLKRPQCLVVTSPHYLHLVQRAKSSMPVFYYCSDDYSEYEGWGGDLIQMKERVLVRTVNHSFFVSETLAARARTKYGVLEDSVSVSANASEQRFCNPVEKADIEKLLSKYPQLKRPIVGVVGGVNDRLDFELILACANHSSVGSVVLVGGIDHSCQDHALESLRHHPKCLMTGVKPHLELPVWMQMLDLALIPYADTPLNRACSPMRLFDHLASGVPIVSSSNCNQVCEYNSDVLVGYSREQTLEAVVKTISQRDEEGPCKRQQKQSKLNTWDNRAEGLFTTFSSYF